MRSFFFKSIAFSLFIWGLSSASIQECERAIDSLNQGKLAAFQDRQAYYTHLKEVVEKTVNPSKIQVLIKNFYGEKCEKETKETLLKAINFNIDAQSHNISNVQKSTPKNPAEIRSHILALLKGTLISLQTQMRNAIEGNSQRPFWFFPELQVKLTPHQKASAAATLSSYEFTGLLLKNLNDLLKAHLQPKIPDLPFLGIFHEFQSDDLSKEKDKFFRIYFKCLKNYILGIREDIPSPSLWYAEFVSLQENVDRLNKHVVSLQQNIQALGPKRAQDLRKELGIYQAQLDEIPILEDYLREALETAAYDLDSDQSTTLQRLRKKKQIQLKIDILLGNKQFYLTEAGKILMDNLSLQKITAAPASADKSNMSTIASSHVEEPTASTQQNTSLQDADSSTTSTDEEESTINTPSTTSASPDSPVSTTSVSLSSGAESSEENLSQDSEDDSAEESFNPLAEHRRHQARKARQQEALQDTPAENPLLTSKQNKDFIQRIIARHQTSSMKWGDYLKVLEKIPNLKEIKGAGGSMVSITFDPFEGLPIAEPL